MSRYKKVLIAPYFGSWPVWFDAFLVSCKCNPDYDWLIPTDCPIPDKKPDNVKFIKYSFSEIKNAISDALEVHVGFSKPYKLCDVKPMFGLIFKEHVGSYDFWGHCDIDIIWGKISNFIDDEILVNYDIVTSRKNKISGHFALYRNKNKTNTLFKYHPKYKEALANDASYYFDEVGMTEVVEQYKDELSLKIFWPEYLFNYANYHGVKAPSLLPKLMNKWQWDKGKIYDLNNGRNEVMYLHFMTWKKTLKTNLVNLDNPDLNEFYISYTHIARRKCKVPATMFSIPFYRLFPSLYM